VNFKSNILSVTDSDSNPSPDEILRAAIDTTLITPNTLDERIKTVKRKS